MEAKDKQAFDALKSAHKALEGQNKKLLAESLKKDSVIATLEGQITAGSEELKAAHLTVKNTEAEKAAVMQDLNKVTMERDNALQIITELSTQVADQSSVQTEKDILVNVKGQKYLYERRSLHTVNGEVKPEDAAKDEKFLLELIKNGSGIIRKVEN